MKKYYFLIIVALIFGLVLTGCRDIANITAPGTADENLSRVYPYDDWSAYDMWKGEFVRINTTYAAYNPGGEVIINYVKGQKAYMINVQVYGIPTDRSWGVWLMTNSGYNKTDMESPGGNHLELGDLIVDEYGFGRLHVNGNDQIDEFLDNEAIRVNIYGSPLTGSSSDWILSTSPKGEWQNYGDFQPIDSNREE